MTKKTNAPRVPLLDEARGLSIILMVFYHLGYDLVAIFGVNLPFFFTGGMDFLRNVIAGIFLFVSGICCHFSKNNLRRGAITFGFGLLMTAVTALTVPEQIIRFGVLHLLGASMLLFALLERPLKKLSPMVGFTLFLVLFLILYPLPTGGNLPPPFTVALPSALYQSPYLFPLGLPGPSFFSSDYYPLLPWSLLFLAGSSLGGLVKAGRFPAPFYKSHIPFLATVGRNTIYIYLLHQPILYGVLSLLFLFVK